jgi:hypothetical protein
MWDRGAELSLLVPGGKELPVPLGDDFDGTIGQFDGGLIVDRVARHRHAGEAVRAASLRGAGRSLRGFLADPNASAHIDHAITEVVRCFRQAPALRPAHDR